MAETFRRATPLSIPPSEYFEGNDGKWSTFFVQVGTPPQAVRLLPGTSASAGNTVWVVLSEGCTDENSGFSGCLGERHVFYRNESTTWNIDRLENGGLYELNTKTVETPLGLDGNALYGFDTVQLGVPGNNLPSLSSQVVAGIATDNYWLGSLPLSPLAHNFTDIRSPVPSMLSNLRNQSFVPSTTWGYTAGASYQDPVVYGSLTLGGYDSARFDDSKALRNIGFGADQSKDLMVQLRSIAYNTLGSSPLLATSHTMFIDSMVAQLWLPVPVCKAFETAFNLTWNATEELYIIDDNVHNSLLAQNPAFTFTLGSGTETVDITLPYAAFDLEVSQPILMNGTSRYFPLKQAQHTTQYTLGRVFLQEAYIIADYDRRNFTVAQARFPGAGEQELKAILPPELTVMEHDVNDMPLSTGAIVGIAIGGVAIFLFLVIGLWALRRRHKRRCQNRDSQMTLVASQMSSPWTDKGDGEVFSHFRPQNKQMGEIQTYSDIPFGGVLERFETDGRPLHPPELDGEERHRHDIGEGEGWPYEMGGGEAPFELEAPRRERHEDGLR